MLPDGPAGRFSARVTKTPYNSAPRDGPRPGSACFLLHLNP